MNRDYITDIPYTNQFYGNLNPHLIHYVGALHGYPTLPLHTGFNYLELGCGNGLSTNILAASNPHARFWGLDFNPEHIANARDLAQAGGLRNITFLENSFADLPELSLPAFDFVTIHGVYSWISQEMRQYLIHFFEKKLRPGGFLLLSYNAQPGWSAFAPLREIMRTYTLEKGHTVLQKAQKGLEYLRFLCDLKVGYFKMNPSAEKMLEELERSDIRYVVHEYFTPHWNPMYFAEVAAELQEAHLQFVGTLPIYLNYGEVCLPENVQEFFQTAPDRATFEMHKDFVRNTTFRWDIYTKPTQAPAPMERLRFEEMAFGSFITRENIALQASLPGGRNVTLAGELYEVLVEQLTTSPQTLQQLLAHPNLASFPPEDVLSAVHYLIMLDQMRPFAQAAEAPPFLPERWELTSPFNRVLLERYLFTGEPLVLASERAGTGMPLAFGDALMLWAIPQVGLEQAPAWAVAELERRGYSITDTQEEPSLNATPPLALLQRQCEKFQEHLSYWLSCGIITPAKSLPQSFWASKIGT